MDFENELFAGLPAYQGGKMAVDFYDCGGGLSDFRNFDDVSLPIEDGIKIDLEEFKNKVNCLMAEYGGAWENTLDGSLSAKVFYKRRMVQIRYKNGEVKAFYVDPYVPTENPPRSFMRTVINTCEKEFLQYLKTLENMGFEVVFENKIEQNIYRLLKKEDREIYAYFSACPRTAKFVDGKVGLNVAEFSEKEANTQGKTEFYQYALKQGKRLDGTVMDCGMLYIMKLADNSYFIVDGGAYEQATDDAVSEIYKFLREKAQLKQNEKIKIAAWFCTHAHRDHIEIFAKLLRVYHNDIELERVFFNFPSNKNYYFEAAKYIIINRINQYYPAVKFLKAHTGQRFFISNAEFTVLQTHEDFAALGGDEKLDDFNDTTTVIMVNVEGKKLLFLGDINKLGEAQLLKNFSAETLKCDLVQAAHHVFNRLNYIYDIAAPKYITAPANPQGRYNQDNLKYKRLILSCKPENVFYSSEDGTVGFKIEKGEIEYFYHEELKGKEFDGSDL